MANIKRLLLHVFTICVLGVFQVAMIAYSPPKEPQTLEEVADIVGARGLYCRSDRQDGLILNRLLVSDEPLTMQRTCRFRFGPPTPEAPGFGLVAVCHPAKQYLPSYEPGRSVVWGDVLLHGDPEVIRRLTGRSE